MTTNFMVVTEKYILGLSFSLQATIYHKKRYANNKYLRSY